MFKNMNNVDSIYQRIDGYLVKLHQSVGGTTSTSTTATTATAAITSASGGNSNNFSAIDKDAFGANKHQGYDQAENQYTQPHLETDQIVQVASGRLCRTDQELLLQFTCGKLTQTVKAELLETVGLFTEYFTGIMFDKSAQLISIFMETLGSQLKSKTPETFLIKSSLLGLNSLLLNFSSDFISGSSKNVQLLYQYLYICLDPVSSSQRFDIPRAAMMVVQRHTSLFKQYLTEQSEKFFARLEEWCKHINKKNRDLAFNTIDSFLQQIANELTVGNRSIESDQATFKYFIRKFYSIFENNNSTPFDISIAIRGCGRFAAPVKAFIGEWELKSLLGSLFKFSEKLMVVKLENIDEIVMHLSSFINAFSNILFEIKDIEYWYMEHLEQAVATYFIIFPYLFTVQRERYYSAVNRLLSSLYHRPEFLKTLLGRIVRQGLLITFSKPHEALLPHLNTGDTPWYEVYKEVWYHLLHPKPSDISRGIQMEVEQHVVQQVKQEEGEKEKEKEKDSISISTSEDIIQLLYNEIVQTMITFIRKLDLSYSTKEEEEERQEKEKELKKQQVKDKDKGGEEEKEEEEQQEEEDVTMEDQQQDGLFNIGEDTLKPSTPKDIELFLNLVEFSKLFLARQHTNLLTRWIYIFGKEIIFGSRKYPLISGFYKLLHVLLKVAKKVNYFGFIDGSNKSSSLDANGGEDDSMEIDSGKSSIPADELENKRNCFKLFAKFLKEVEAASTQYKDELLASVIQLLLSVPKQLVNIPVLIPTLSTAFRLGLSYLKLGHVGLNTIEYWLSVLPEEVDAHLYAILPALSDYFLISTTNTSSSNQESANSKTGMLMGRGAAPRMNTKSIDFVDPKLLAQRTVVEEMQTRVIRILGKLGGQNYHLMGSVNLMAPGTESGVAWDTISRIQLQIPLGDLNGVSIYLDSVLPVIVTLATRSTHRQTKVVACELLHSIVLYMVGTNSGGSFHRLYRRVFPALLRLAVDVEVVARQLFSPLIMQLVHWFTKNVRAENDETMALLNSIIDAVNGEDGALREFGARALGEFASWSLKHAPTTKSTANEARSAFNFKSLLKRVYSLAAHPSAQTRMGAAASLLSLIRVMREDDNLISVFLFEIAHQVLLSMRLCGAVADEGDDTTTLEVEVGEKLQAVIDAVVRVIERRAELLNRTNNNRREHKDLADFVGWVFGEVGRMERRVRFTSIALFGRVVQLLPGQKRANIWIQHQVKQHGLAALIKMAEPPQTASAMPPKLDGNNHRHVEFWMRRLQASLAVYIWYFGEGFTDPVAISKDGSSRIISNAFYVFLSEYALVDQSHPAMASLTPREIDQFMTLKCQTLEHVYALFSMLLEKYNYSQVMETGGLQLLRVVGVSLLTPAVVGYRTIDNNNNASNSGNNKQVNELPLNLIVDRVCQLIVNQGDKYRDTLIGYLGEMISSSSCNLGEIGVLITTEGTDRLVSLINGYNILQKQSILDVTLKFAKLSLPAMTSTLFDYLNEHVDNITPAHLIVYKEILVFILSTGHIQPSKLLEYLLPPIKVLTKSTTTTTTTSSTITDKQLEEEEKRQQKQIEHQSNFYKTYHSELIEYISKNFESFSPLFIDRIVQTNHIDTILNDICIYKQTIQFNNTTDKQSKKNDMKSIMIPFLIKISSHLLKDVGKTTDKENIIEFTKNLINIDTPTFFETKEGYDFVYQLLINYLNRSNSLAFKNKALVLLPDLLLFPKHHNYNLIQEKLNEIVVYDFPLSSKDLTKGSPIYNEYITTIERFLNTLEITCNPMIIDTLLQVLKEQDHSHITHINQSIERFIVRTNDSQAKEVFSHCFAMFMSNDYQDELKITLIDKFCVPLIGHMKQQVLIQLFAQHLSSLMSIIQPLAPKYLATAIERKSSVVEKICCFKLTQQFYESLPATVIRDQVNPYFTGDKHDAKGTELTAAIMKAAHLAKSEKLATDEQHVTRVLATKYHGAAYSALASVVATTQTKETFFHVFFFKENKEKNEYLWENIIDLEQQYNFEPETNFQISSQLSSAVANSQSRDLKYLSSQYLQDSSLSQSLDVDTSSSTTSTSTTTTSNNNNLKIVASAMNMPIELDKINSNPSMQPMLKIIDIYQERFRESIDQSPNDMPKWMNELYLKVKNDTNLHPNILIFILKVIINRQQYFYRYHKQWTPILIEYVISNQTGGQGIHYFIRDIAMLLLSWPNIYQDQKLDQLDTLSKSNISKFINFLIQNSYCADRQILRNNLNILKLFVERWKGLFSVEKKSIVEALATPVTNFKSKARQVRSTALIQLSILLSNGYAAYDKENDSEISEFKFYQILIDCLTEYKELYDAASEICGMILQFNHKHNIQSVFEKLLKDKISSFLSQSDYQRALNCLYFIGLHHPSFILQFQLKLLNILPQLSNEIRLVAFNVIYWIADDIPELFIKLKSANLDSLIRIREEQTQIIILKILFKLIKNNYTTDQTLLQIINLLLDCRFNQSPNETCRLLYYDIFMWIHDYLEKDVIDQNQIRLTLLIGLSDDSEAVKRKLLEFWDTSKELSLSTVQRLMQLFEKMYTKETESQWLGYCCSLLLQLCTRSSDFTKLLFDKPLSECTFREYNLDASWQNRTSNMNPLFSSSQLDEESSQLPTFDGDNFGPRATQLPMFSLTQSSFSQFYPSGSSSSYSELSSSQEQSSSATTSTTFSVGSAPDSSQSGKAGNKRTVNNKPEDKAGTFKVPANIDPRVMEMRNRFKKKDNRTDGERNAAFARLAVKKSKDRDELMSRAKQARENQVTMFRKYRSGELPDIQIKLQEILRPLQSLCQMDHHVGTSVFSLLFTTIYQHCPRDQVNKFKSSCKQSIEKIIDSNATNSALILSLLKIVEKNLELTPSPASIASASNASGNHPMGIIVIESIIESLLPTKPSSKQYAQNQATISESWDHLRELYHALKEEDIVLGLLERQMGELPYTKRALEAELSNDWVAVLKAYDDGMAALESGQLAITPSARETSLWENGRLQCYESLREWSNLKANFIAYYPGGPQSVFEEQDEATRHEMMSHFLQYSLKVKENWPDLYQFMGSLTPSQHQYMESSFPGELAFLEITRSDFNRSQYYIQKFYRLFRDQWASTHPLALASRHRILQPIQKVVEVEEFLGLVTNDKRAIEVDKMEKLVSLWKTRYPSSFDDILVWDDLVSFRSVLLEKIYERFIGQNNNDEAKEDGVKNLLIRERAELYHQMSKGARKLGNIIVSEAYFRLAVKSYPKTRENDLAFPLVSSLIKIYCLKAKNSTTQVETLDRFIKALKFVESKSDEDSIKNNPDNLQRYKRLHGNIQWEIYQLDQKLGSNLVMENLKKNGLTSLSSLPTTRLSSELFSLAYQSYSQSIQLYDSNSNNNNDTHKSKSAYLQFGNFCDTELQRRGDQSEDSNRLAVSVVNSIMNAIKQEIPGAIEKFPRLLEIISQYEKAAKEFVERTKQIPCWMFIRWQSQMFPYLDTPQGPYILPILQEIASNYPQAIYFPFKISSEQFGPTAKKLTAKLEQTLKNPLIDTLISEFERLTHPEHRFKDYMETVKTMMKSTPINTSEIQKLGVEIYNDCFNPHTVRGDYNLKFAKEWDHHYSQHFSKDGSKLAKMDVKKLVELVADMSGKMAKTMKPSSTATMKLKDFSNWLVEFDRSNQLTEIELPGQYHGTSKPQPEIHIKISSFDPNLLVMGSLRKPKRIKIHGSDEQDYPFLIKGGEDLRLDQRIQQLFFVMNEILKRDPATSKRGLHIKTYQVVPMTGKVGIIEWLNDTKPLKEIIEDQMAVHQNVERSNVSLSRMEAYKIHNEWINSFGKYIKMANPPAGPLYQQMFMHSDRADAIKKQEKQHDKVPANLLQNGIWAISSSPESYLFIRNSFARSLATFSICSYIIGIGDRHLENFLISQKDGILIGIDFGHAFGTATQFLPIPELMPFRLTRQFTSFLMPLDSVGLLSHNMTHTLTAIQNNKDFLLSTMDVFVKEPLIDWIKLASRLGKEQGKGHKSVESWFPKEKVDIARRKLERWNPAYITSEELANSVHKGQIYEKSIQNVVKGDPKHNIRAKACQICSTAKEQVDCLIDQSTDPNILARAWAGWSSWI
ncbi:DNA-dependent protein kinase subunit [Heterostelium album PN500]|uniref:DNA-dependent protein kinase catalytic subunit n=1 Tax=Heterostelium pallidum (strain ATCC 26659 / Pp 5 / PN500) TaxID=670386 RepID=D3BG64_HETP5|nr:DNA-dependent protein kinase subunit [Heterostelium album PN500]EFA79656.1 DNA-dependent protein kinase subunit [Heterostelium album PN500]|eukprot:XP_020431777.1 DNA-dependent protein kinase subunit [Heterostelium album PN500]